MKNFFEHQDQARQKTRYLVFLLGCAIAATVALLYITLWFTNISIDSGTADIDTLSVRPLWRPDYLIAAVIITIATVGYGSAQKMHSLRSGGSAVATSLGGRLVTPGTADVQAQVLLNVVAEMAIASGTAVPEVYVLPDTSINAFAAGFDPNDAVIGVTQGTLTQLKRDELQGVIGHEFSHIVNGDMRLNLKLIGLVHGLLFMHIIGRQILFRGPRISLRTSKGKGSASFAITMGGTMLVIGGVGWIFGQLIKSAISRQREFLADAAAVQFTRDPNGLANALRRIATGSSGHSPIASPQAASASHLFFNEISALSAFITPFATHPPLTTRIRRLGGSTADLGAPSLQSIGSPKLQLVNQLAGTGGSSAQMSKTAVTNRAATMALSAGTVLANIGTVTPANLEQAHALLRDLPERLRVLLRSQPGAVAIIYGLLLDPAHEIREQQKQIVAESSATVSNLLEEIEPLLSQVTVRSRLPLIELCIPSLRTLKPAVAAQFFERIKALVRTDSQLSIFEYALQTVLQYRLAPHFRPASPPAANITHLSELWPEYQLLVATLAKAGHSHAHDVEYAFRNGVSSISIQGCPPLSSTVPACSLPDLSRALKRLRLAAPKLKQSIASACAHTVLIDGRTTDQEAELLRSILIALGCPIPPFLELKSNPTKISNQAA